MPEDYRYMWPGMESPDGTETASGGAEGGRAEETLENFVERDGAAESRDTAFPGETGGGTPPFTVRGNGIGQRRVTTPSGNVPEDERRALHDSAVADLDTYTSAAYDAVNGFANSGALDELRGLRRGSWNPFSWLASGHSPKDNPYTDANGNYLYDPSGAFADQYGNRYLSNGQYQDMLGRRWRDIRQTANNDPWVLAKRYLYAEDADMAIRSIDDVSKTMLKFSSQTGSVSAGAGRLYAGWADGVDHSGWSADAEDANRNMEAAAAMLDGARRTVESGPGIFMGMRQAVLDPETYFLGIGNATTVQPALKSLNRHIEGLGDGSRTDGLTNDETILLQSLALSSEMNSFMQPLVTGTGVDGGKGIVDLVVSSLELWGAFDAGGAVISDLVGKAFANVIWRSVLGDARFADSVAAYLSRPDVFDRLPEIYRTAARKGGREFAEAALSDKAGLSDICSALGTDYKTFANDLWTQAKSSMYDLDGFKTIKGGQKVTYMKSEGGGYEPVREPRLGNNENVPLLSEMEAEEIMKPRPLLESHGDALFGKVENGISHKARAENFGRNALNFFIEKGDSDSNALAADLIFSDTFGFDGVFGESSGTVIQSGTQGGSKATGNPAERKFGHKRAEYMDSALESAAKKGKIKKMNDKEKNEFFTWLAGQNTEKFESYVKSSEMWKETDFPALPDDSKIQKIIFKWYTDGTAAPDLNEQAIYDAIATAEKLHLDAMHFPSPESLLNSEEVTTRIGARPDGMPGLSLFRDIGDGVKVYTVEDSEEARESMRKIIDTHFGKKEQTWCILASDGEGHLTEHSKVDWDSYPYGRMVAFKDGKLVAFNAAWEPEKSLGTNWRNRFNKHFDAIPYKEEMPDGFTKRTTIDIDGKIKTQYLEKGDRKKYDYVKKDTKGNILEIRTKQKGNEFGGYTFRYEMKLDNGIKETFVGKTNSYNRKVTEEKTRLFPETDEILTTIIEYDSKERPIKETSTTSKKTKEKTVVTTNYDGNKITGKTTEKYKNGKLSSYIIEEPLQDEFGSITSSYNGSGRLLSVDVKNYYGLTRTYDSRQSDKAAIISAISTLAPVATLSGFLSPQNRKTRRASRHYAERNLNRLSKRTDRIEP